MRIEWHPGAVEDFLALGKPDQTRIRKAIDDLARTEDARQRLLPYSGALKGYWKLRIGDFRLVCEIFGRDDQVVMVIHLAHRSRAYDARSARTIRSRSR